MREDPPGGQARLCGRLALANAREQIVERLLPGELDRSELRIALRYRCATVWEDNDDEGVGLRLDELLWDEWNEDHIARHGVEADEVEDAVFDPTSVVLRTRGTAQRRHVVLGRTASGRHLFVVLELIGGNRGYVVTARDMSAGERRRFRTKFRTKGK